ncbi:hypothetical protein BC936DRAFT_145291 [Jimgerdemannia flammicorona]|uniref:Uncharacterized protein n=2 Tax=Jimgerdemannia flammicorona TaxID=994334 RepID=A0A433QY12_9FUNG|nr:hypothetical protein BC936DRAFT_145291 [Jimgerdemannia flammicorona]RUS34604.1 hypothetical protein BC938DRAFT_479516 [Jimgerdemannia flammicorona]
MSEAIRNKKITETVLYKAEVSKVLRALKTRLALANFKAQKGLENYDLASLETKLFKDSPLISSAPPSIFITRTLEPAPESNIHLNGTRFLLDDDDDDYDEDEQMDEDNFRKCVGAPPGTPKQHLSTPQVRHGLNSPKLSAKRTHTPKKTSSKFNNTSGTGRMASFLSPSTSNFDEWITSPKGTPRSSFTPGEDVRSTPLQRMNLLAGVRTPEHLLAAAAQLELPADALDTNHRHAHHVRADKTPDNFSAHGPTTPRQQIQSPSAFPVHSSSASVADTDAANLLVMLHNSPSPSFMPATSSTLIPPTTGAELTPRVLGPQSLSYGSASASTRPTTLLTSTSTSTAQTTPTQLQQSNNAVAASPNLWRSSSTPPSTIQYGRNNSRHKSSDSPSRHLVEKRRRVAAANNNVIDPQAIQSWFPVVRSPLSREVSVEVDGIESRRSRSVPPSQLGSAKEGALTLALLAATATGKKRKDPDFEIWQDTTDRQEEEEGYHSSRSVGEAECEPKHGRVLSESEIAFRRGLFEDDGDNLGAHHQRDSGVAAVSPSVQLMTGLSPLQPLLQQQTIHDHANHGILLPPQEIDTPNRASVSTTAPATSPTVTSSSPYFAPIPNALYNSAPSNVTVSALSPGRTPLIAPHVSNNGGTVGGDQRRWSYHLDHRPPSPANEARYDDKVVLKVEIDEEPGPHVLEPEVKKDSDGTGLPAGGVGTASRLPSISNLIG